MGRVWQITAMVPVGDGRQSPLPGKGEERVLVHLDLTADDLGIEPPPSRCHIRAHKTTSGWILLVWAPEGTTEAIRAWARARTSSTEIGFGEVGERTIGFHCESLPEAWQTLFGLFDAEVLVMSPDGDAQTRIQGTREEVGEFLVGWDLEASTESVKIQPEADERERSNPLTRSQEIALGRAAALGYFDVPRRIQLEELARELDASPSALSELLRRAESRLISAYLGNRLGGIEAVVDFEQPSEGER